MPPPPPRDTTAESVGTVFAMSDVRDVSAEDVESVFVHAFENVGIPTLLVALDGRVISANDAMCEMLGRTGEEIRALADFGVLVHPDDREFRGQAVRRMLAGEPPIRHEERYVRPDGSVLTVIGSRSLVRNRAGKPLLFLVQAEDISERKAAEQALRASEERFRLLAENAQDFIFRVTVAPEIRFDYVSPASTRVTGYTPEELYDEPSHVFNMVTPEYIEGMRERERQGEIDRLWDLQIRRKDGSVIWGEQRLTAVRDENGQVVAVEGIVRDVSERKKAQHDLEHLALHDALTELPNRAWFMDQLNRSLARTVRSDAKLALLFVDLDGFKDVNDKFGHDAGDQLLFSVSGRLRAVIRPSDVLARLGGDEFTIICDDIASVDQASGIASRVMEAFERPFRIAPGDVSVSASVGVAVSDGSDTASSLLQAADAAMYRAKAGGKARFHISA